MLPNLKLKAPNSKIKIKRVFKLIKIIFLANLMKFFFTKKYLSLRWKKNTRTIQGQIYDQMSLV